MLRLLRKRDWFRLLIYEGSWKATHARSNYHRNCVTSVFIQFFFIIFHFVYLKIVELKENWIHSSDRSAIFEYKQRKTNTLFTAACLSRRRGCGAINFFSNLRLTNQTFRVFLYIALSIIYINYTYINSWVALTSLTHSPFCIKYLSYGKTFNTDHIHSTILKYCIIRYL